MGNSKGWGILNKTHICAKHLTNSCNLILGNKKVKMESVHIPLFVVGC